MRGHLAQTIKPIGVLCLVGQGLLLFQGGGETSA